MTSNRTNAGQAAREHLDEHLKAIDALQKKIVALHDPKDALGRKKLDASFADMKDRHAEFADACCVVVGNAERPPKD